MKTLGIVLMVSAAIFVFAQDIDLQVLKDEWQVIALFAVDEKGQAVTDLEKADIEFLLDGQNTREFLLVKRDVARTGRKRPFEEDDRPGKEKKTIIIMVFDTLFSDRDSLQVFAAAARHIVHQARQESYFSIMTTENLTTKAKRNRGDVLRVIEEKTSRSPDQGHEQEKIDTFFQSFAALQRGWHTRDDIKITYIFIGRLPAHEGQNVIDVGQMDGPLFFIHTETSSPGQDAIVSLGRASGARCISGSSQEIITEFDHLQRGYYEIYLPAVKSFKGRLRQITIHPLRPGVVLHTAKKFAKNLESVPGKQELLEKTFDKKDLAEQPLADQKETPAPAQGMEAIIKRLEENRFNLKSAAAMFTCGQAIIYLKQGRLEKALAHLHRIAGMEGKAEIDFIQRAIKEVNQAIRVEQEGQISPRSAKDACKEQLTALGAGQDLLAYPAFIDVVSHAQRFYKNDKGFWEAVFANDTVMVYIPEGSFSMGLPWESGGAQDESPEHEVVLDGYWIAKYETTFRQYDQFCKLTGRAGPKGRDFGRGRRPVVNVSWHDAAAYCRWLAKESGLPFRMPSEAEWEKAARGSDGRTYPWGFQKPDGRKANFADVTLLYRYKRMRRPEAHGNRLDWMDKTADDYYAYTAPVGKYPQGASPFGVMDMAGNVWEFVQDWYDGDYYQRSPKRNPSGPTYDTRFKVARGGGWDSHHWMLRTTSRAAGLPDKGSDALGFRVAISITSPLLE